MAEAHPVGFRWVMKARERGAKIIHVDPRFSRTSAMADLHVPIRAGTDIAFLGGLIRHVLETESYFKEYVVHYTNAATIVNEDFQDTEDLGGVLLAASTPRRAPTTARRGCTRAARSPPPAGQREHSTQAFEREDRRRHDARATSSATRRCSTRAASSRSCKRHFARYTPEMVERICGIPREQFLEVAETLIANSGRERTTALVYAVGWTQHTAGVQMIRAGAILQLLLGNIGRPGGGDHGACAATPRSRARRDIPTLYDLLPGYLHDAARRARASSTLEDYIDDAAAPTRGWWSNFDKYIVSLLKAWFGDAATAENDYGFAPPAEDHAATTRTSRRCCARSTAASTGCS